MHGTLLGRAWLALVLIVGVSCVEEVPATAVTVVVRSDLVIGEEIDALEVRLLAEGDLGDDAEPSREYSLAMEPAPGQHALPLSFAIAAKRNASRESFRLVVTGLRGGKVVVEAQAVAAFVPEKRRLLEIFLDRGCIDILCRDDGMRTGKACSYVSEAWSCQTVEPKELPPAPDPIDELEGGPDAGRRPMDASEVGPEPDPDAEAGLRDGGEAGPDDVPTIPVDAPMMDANPTDANPTDAPPDANPVPDAGGCSPACMNGGTCRTNGTCDCSAVDYDGASCQTPIDNCSPNPCLHGGRCEDGVRAFTCHCDTPTTGFTATTCNMNFNECSSPTTNVCAGTTNGTAFSYQCVDYTNETVGYHCRGQFPEQALPALGTTAGRFTVAGGVVTDTVTTLRWQQTISASSFTHANALTHCASQGTGWRLPTRAELLSIVDYTRADPAIDTTSFPGTPVADFWTSSIWVGNQNNPWHVFFGNGASAPDQSNANAFRVRCVQ